MIGKAVSHYKVIEKLGEGGMGEVFLAEDTALKRKVALKFIAEEYVSDPDFVARFTREAQAAAGLNHPNIVTVYEVGHHEGRPFIAMAYVDGDTLSNVIENNTLTLDNAIDIATQICEGLANAHEQGIVHRDIKPDNILIDREGRVKILDFGLAKLKGASKQSTVHSTLGTIYYMSPEQARGEDVDHRSDFFSLGSVLYEMLTGQSPFKREHSAAVLYSIANEEPSPMTQYHKVPAVVEKIVRGALAKNPDERYQSANDFAADLKRVRAGAHPMGIKSKTELFKYVLPTSAVFLGVILLLIFKPFQFEVSGDQEAIAAENSLAVMYFENVAEQDDPQRLGDIVTNLLITDLSESAYMEVVSRQRLYDILKQEGKEDEKVIDRSTATKVATKAGAKWMLLGSILQTKPRIVMTSQLIDVERGNVAASQRITGESGEEIFSLVDRLTGEIKQDLALPAAASRETDTPIAEITTHSTEAYRHYLDGVDYLNKYFGKEAKQSFETALALDSTLAMAHLGLAHYIIPGTRSEKVDCIDKALKYADKLTDRERRFIASSKARFTGDFDLAIKELESVLAENPNDKEAYKALGEIHRTNLRDIDKAIEYYRKAIEIDPRDKWSYNLLAYQYQAIGDIDNYIWAIYQYMTLAPDEPNPYDSRGDLYAYSGKVDKAIDSYSKALERKPDFYPSQAKIGHMYLFKQNYAEAARNYEMLVAGDDDDWRSAGRGFLSLIPLYQGKLKETVAVLNDALREDREEGYEGWAYRSKLYDISWLYLEMGNVDGAMEIIKDMMKQSQQKEPAGIFHLRDDYAYLLARKGDIGAAKKVLAELKIDIEAKDKSLINGYWFSKGWVAMVENEYDSACVAFDKAAQNSPSFHYQYSTALACLKAGRVPEAVNTYEQMLRRFSEDRASEGIWGTKLYYYSGVAYEEAGRHEKAIGQYRKFLDHWAQADATIPEVLDAKERLARMANL